MNRSAPISQVDIEEEMLRLLEMLERETEAFEQLSIDAAKKDAAYKSEWAKQYLSILVGLQNRRTSFGHKTCRRFG